MLELPNFDSKWIKSIKNILNEIGRNDIWHNQINIQTCTLKYIVKQTLIDQNQQIWQTSLQNSSKGLSYGIYKESIQLENYILNLDKKDWLQLLKFRTANHHFPCETGRWSNTDINDRTCKLCRSHDIADVLFSVRLEPLI